MTYESATTFSQIAALVIFIALFLGVILYVFWPGNKKKFDETANLPLEDKDDEPEQDGDRQ
ncbi:MAG: cbb3-type cytochrome c oxidase subunit 3 [Hyphomicrobium sp.]|jgi:cytochrome c oxidase cbb3-type subunit 4